MSTTSNDIIVDTLPCKDGCLGLITLNRPQAMQALTHAMTKQLFQQLLLWKKDDEISAVIIQSNSNRAFCAGGDIREIYEDGTRDHTQTQRFFWHEYRLNYLIHTYPKPYIALLDGLTLGGGVGISLHASHCIATEKVQWAMPEARIGFIPDVGASFFLARLPDSLGIYLGLTGERLNAADAYHLSLIPYYVPSNALTNIIDTLQNAHLRQDTALKVDNLIKHFVTEPPPSTIAAHKIRIHECFHFDSVTKIMNALQEGSSAWDKKTLLQLQANSPTSLCIILEELKRARKLALPDCLNMEYRLACHCLANHDFYEGIRAAIIDKDHQPRWSPETVDDVTHDMVEHYFHPVEKELTFNVEQ